LNIERRLNKNENERKKKGENFWLAAEKRLIKMGMKGKKKDNPGCCRKEAK